VEADRVDVVMEDPVRVEKNPLLMLTVDPEKIWVNNVLAVPVEKAIVDPKKVEVVMEEPKREE
jgi:hypothetical protein